MGRSKGLFKYNFKKVIMKKINVIDLDNTLIPFDSFKFLVIEEMKKMNIIVIILTILRKMRLIKLANFKYLITTKLRLVDNQDKLNQICDKISELMSEVILEKVNKYSGEDTMNILCSASSEEYVKIIAEKLGWEGYGSHFVGNFFFHMYGTNKADFIKSKFPQKDYIYNFAISDSETDLELLKLFKIWELYK